MFGDDLEEIFEFEREEYPERLLEFIDKHNQRNGTSYKLGMFPKSLIGEYLVELTWENSHYSQMYYEDKENYLMELLEEYGWNKQDSFKITASKCDWTGKSGYRYFDWETDDINDFITETFGSFGNEFSANIWIITKDRIVAGIGTHDVYGSEIIITKAQKCQNSWCEEEYFEPVHKNHMFCSVDCRKDCA